MTKTKFEAMDILNKYDIPCGPILSMKELAEEQSLRATGTVVEVDHPDARQVSVGRQPDQAVGQRVRSEALAVAGRAHRRDPARGAAVRRCEGRRRSSASGASRRRDARRGRGVKPGRVVASGARSVGGRSFVKKPMARPTLPDRQSDNDKRRLHPAPDPAGLALFALRATYNGISKHKAEPLRFGLPPYQGRRGDETLCDRHAGFEPDDLQHRFTAC